MSNASDSAPSEARRRLLRRAGLALALPLAGSLPLRTLAAPPLCVVRPAQTAGPFYLERRLERSDIRSDPADAVPRPGVPLQLDFRVGRIADDDCTPLAEAIVDVWQCDAGGVYSGVRMRGAEPGADGFMRGYQRTDEDGVARFVTIVPGGYPGRAVHIHFTARSTLADGRRHAFTSQLYFDDALIDEVHADPAYARHSRRRTRNAEDGIFRRGGGERLLLEPIATADGLAATFDLGLVL
jgi:protocatechuate 3,4-dioxygenase beta subunit